MPLLYIRTYPIIIDLSTDPPWSCEKVNFGNKSTLYLVKLSLEK